jgi:hypothetical protein
MTYPDGTFTVTLEAEELTDVVNPDIYLDRLLLFPECNSTPQQNDNVSTSYDDDTDTTTFILPYTFQGTTDAVIRFDNPSRPGLWIGSAPAGADRIACQIHGDWRGQKIGFGTRYNFEYIFTSAYVPTKDQARQRVVGELDGRLQVATWSINHFNTGSYEVVVSRKNRANDSVTTFRARRPNVDGNMLDSETDVLDTGHVRVPIYSRNTDCTIKVQSDSWLPVTLMSACWEGNYNNRARSIG